ncbi:MAG: hypothetical protein ABIG28_01675 [archaeon]
MKLKKCKCGYTLEEECEKCGKTEEAHYKFVKIKNVEKFKRRK